MAFSVATYVRRAEQERERERQQREERRRRQSQIETYRHRERENLSGEDAVRTMTHPRGQGDQEQDQDRDRDHQQSEGESDLPFNYVDIVVVREETEQQQVEDRGDEGGEAGSHSTLEAAALEQGEIRGTEAEAEAQERSSSSTSTSASSNTNTNTQQAECRICQELDEVHLLEQPCKCKGSLQYVHHKCLQKWCIEKGDLMCEICKTEFQGDYYAPAPRPTFSPLAHRGSPAHHMNHRALSTRGSSHADLIQAAYSRAFVGWLVPERAVTHSSRSGREGEATAGGTSWAEDDRDFQENRFFSRPFLRVYLAMLLGVSVIHTVLLFVTDEDDAPPITFLVAFVFRVLIFFIPFLVVGRILSTWQHYRRLRDDREPAIFLYDRNPHIDSSH